MSHAILNTATLTSLYQASADGIIAGVASPVCDRCGVKHSAFGWWPADDGAQWCDACWRTAPDDGIVLGQQTQAAS